MSNNKKVKFVETDYNRMVECQLAAIYVTVTRTGLIEIYRAAKKVCKGEDMANFIIPACKERQAFLLSEGIISL